MIESERRTLPSLSDDEVTAMTSASLSDAWSVAPIRSRVDGPPRRPVGNEFVILLDDPTAQNLEQHLLHHEMIRSDFA